ncbi:class I SAM-dependent methyltransferase [Desulfuribacillus alkaliarsenatis]|uniref:16S rRNA (Cytosine(1402)-N(4))-methyltransferase n=1 Tax=Desulfuribacillus alkaliarsenatis TaxID=766136 RepID=A0A1E5FYG1_9FIRM|nr:rRNA adenine N-6-methyltransferase family protein [Desulfuribacillus alkaliarsenatis]OEF95609.1 16S rRNA (cytosine(1402)-N(4))-methyltransferase [Desulfuribacillus alkaliarsenatis]
MGTITYIKNMVKDKYIASITPTSIYGVKDVCKKIDFSKDNVIVEYGPGLGVFSTYILDNMTKDSKLILIERNNDFVDHLKKEIKDSRVTIYHDSAEVVNEALAELGLTEADYIISGIPFSFLTKDIRDIIIESTYNCLKPGGKFLTYQTFFQKNRYLREGIEIRFSRINDSYCFLNAPPLKIHEGIKE